MLFVLSDIRGCREAFEAALQLVNISACALERIRF